MAYPFAPLEAAFFDCDGTLSESELALYDTWVTHVAAAGADFRTFDYARIIGKPDVLCAKIVSDHFGLGRDPEEWHAEYRATFDRLHPHGIPLRPGAIAALDRIAAVGVPLAIVTSGTMEHLEKTLGPHGLLPRFAALVPLDAPGLVGRKPDPAPYLLAAKMLGANPRWCAAFEDTPTGVQSARAAGCLTYAIPHAHSPKENLTEAHVILPSLADFRVELVDEHFAARDRSQP